MKRVLTLDKVKRSHKEDFSGYQVAFKDKFGRVRIGTIRIKPVNCGKKNCRKCPHYIYAYAQYRVGKKVTEKYIGIAR